MSNVAPGGDPAAPDITRYALRGWGPTARLCTIRLSEAAAPLVALIWLALRR
jgi:hypothetical protein